VRTVLLAACHGPGGATENEGKVQGGENECAIHGRLLSLFARCQADV
jgi:hypothetical protein